MTKNPNATPATSKARCGDCGVLPGRDHHRTCQAPEAKLIRRQWAREEISGHCEETK